MIHVRPGLSRFGLVGWTPSYLEAPEGRMSWISERVLPAARLESLLQICGRAPLEHAVSFRTRTLAHVGMFGTRGGGAWAWAASRFRAMRAK